MNPVLLVIGGPNGSGKTTVTERLRADHWSEGVEYLNPDDIAENQFGGWNSVRRGGHTVPLDKILSRYKKAMVNLSGAIALADRVYLYDNSIDDADARLCARTESGRLRKTYGAAPEWVARAIRSLERDAAFEAD